MLISLIVVLIVAALLYWVLTQLPLPPMVKTVATIIIVIVLVLWLVQHVLPGGVNILT